MLEFTTRVHVQIGEFVARDNSVETLRFFDVVDEFASAVRGLDILKVERGLCFGDLICHEFFIRLTALEVALKDVTLGQVVGRLMDVGEERREGKSCEHERDEDGAR